MALMMMSMSIARKGRAPETWHRLQGAGVLPTSGKNLDISCSHPSQSVFTCPTKRSLPPPGICP